MWIPAKRNWSAMVFCFNKESRKSFIDPRKKWNSVNPLQLGILSADAVNAVSPTYKKEILQKDRAFSLFSGANGLEKAIRSVNRRGKLFGILNGFEYPESINYDETMIIKKNCKDELALNFKKPDNFLIGFVGRAVEQKFKLLIEEYDGQTVLERLLGNKNVNFSILTSGLPEYEEFLEQFKDFENVHITMAFDKNLAKKISKGCDLFLMPSLYEPCGITQIESLSSGTPPLVRFTGGLKDTVIQYNKNGGSGFGFNSFYKRGVLKSLVGSVNSAIDLYYNKREEFEKLKEEGFKKRFLWSDSAKEYLEMYNA